MEVAPAPGVRTSTAELFQAVSAPADAVSLQQLLESQKGEALTLTMALDLGAAIAERVGAIHASGRLLGAFDAARVVCTRDGRVLLSKDAAAPLAPELKRGEPPSTAADVYAVGFLIYQLLTGKTPAQATAAEKVSRLREVPPPSRFNDKLDPELDAVVLAALRVEPEGRPASVLVLQAALDGISEELQLAPEPEAIAALVVKLLAQPAPEPRPSPAAAVATSKLQTAFNREAPLFPGRAPEPVRVEALTTSPFAPWLPPSPPAPPPETVPAGRSTRTDPLLPVAQMPSAHETSAQKWLQSPGEESFVEADYSEAGTVEPLVTPGFIAGASVAGVVMLLALVIALLAPSGSAPVVQQVEEHPVRTRSVRPVEAVKAAPVPAVVAKAAPAKKKAVKTAPAKPHAGANSRRMSP